MVFNRFGAAETEAFVGMADSNHVLIVVEQVRILDLIFPRNDIDAVRALVTIINAFFGAIEFFSAVEEGHAL